MGKTPEQHLVEYLLNALNAGDVLFDAAIFLKATDDKYKIIDHPTFNTKTVKEYIPAMFSINPQQKNIRFRDNVVLDITLNFALTALWEGDPYLQKQLDSIERMRKQLNDYPRGNFQVNDVLYQVFNAQDNTAIYPLKWEPNTTYTLLMNIESFNHPNSFTAVDGITIDGAAVLITPGTEGIQKVTFTTGDSPEEEFKQFINGSDPGIMISRSAILKGNQTSITDEIAKAIVENKITGYDNLVDYKNEFENWSGDFITADKSFNYEFKTKAESVVQLGPLTVQDSRERILCAMPITVEMGVDLSFGEDELWELKRGSEFDFTVLYPNDKDFNEITTYRPAHFYNEQVASNFVESVSAQGSFDITYDKNNPVHVDLYNRSLGIVGPSEIYELRITPPYDGASPKTYKVRIQIDPVKLTGGVIKLIGTIHYANQ